MGRKYPRFLYCDAVNTKNEGPFIIHTLPPRFICKPEFDRKRNIIDIKQVDDWGESSFSERYGVYDDLRTWFNFSGRQSSAHPKDRLHTQLASFDFLKDSSNNFTVEQAIAVIDVCFPTKNKNINENHSSYGLKHLMERISEMYTEGDNRKYCSNDTTKEAFEKQGFQFVTKGPNCWYNISEKDYNNINELTGRQ